MPKGYPRKHSGASSLSGGLNVARGSHEGGSYLACTTHVPRMYLPCTWLAPPNPLPITWLVPGFGRLCSLLLHSSFFLLPSSKTRAFLARLLDRAQEPPRRRAFPSSILYPRTSLPAAQRPAGGAKR